MDGGYEEATIHGEGFGMGNKPCYPESGLADACTWIKKGMDGGYSKGRNSFPPSLF